MAVSGRFGMQLPMPILATYLCVVGMACSVLGGFDNEFNVLWGPNNTRVSNRGQQIDLALTNTSGSLINTKAQYLYGKFDMRIKLVPNNSAGTVTTFYMSSKGNAHDEIDLEFLGNLSGMPYLLHTNIFTGGVGDREQQFYLWFDPTAAYHTYSIVWTPMEIIIVVDGIPVRIFGNNKAQGVGYPTSQAMNVYSSIWNGDSWATQGGRVKVDWTKAPFVASYRTYTYTPCVSATATATNTSNGGGGGGCTITSRAVWWDNVNQRMAPPFRKYLTLIQRRYMIYNYCTDSERFPQGFPKECSLPTPP